MFLCVRALFTPRQTLTTTWTPTSNPNPNPIRLQTTGMVRFEENDDDCNSVAMMQRLEAEMGMVVGLSKRVEALDLEVSKHS